MSVDIAWPLGDDGPLSVARPARLVKADKPRTRLPFPARPLPCHARLLGTLYGTRLAMPRGNRPDKKTLLRGAPKNTSPLMTTSWPFRTADTWQTSSVKRPPTMLRA